MNKEDKQKVLVSSILEKIGGFENIKDVYNCATRMRLTLLNDKLANIEELKQTTNLKGALWSNGELQLIIGPEVSIITDLVKKSILKREQNFYTPKNNLNFDMKNVNKITSRNLSILKRFLKGVSAIFGPLIPFLIGVGLIMAIQQLLIRTGLSKDVTIKDAVLGVDYNIFDYVLNVIAGSGFKLMGVIALWSTVRYLGGKTPIAIALGLIMVSPIIPESGIYLIKLGSWDITLKPFYSTILVFILMGIILVNMQKVMDKYFHPIANFIANPLLSLLLGGLLAFFVMGPIMGVVENALLMAFNWFVKLPFGLGTLIVGLTWQPLVVLGVHNILFFAAVTDLVSNANPSIFLAAAFAAAWAQMGATIGVSIISKKMVDKSSGVVAALPGIISGPTESCIYAVNLPKGMPFITGVLAGGIGGWMIGVIGVDLDNLAGLGGIVGFLAYTDDLWKAIVVDLAAFGIGILLTVLFWREDKSEKILAIKSTKIFNKEEFLNIKFDYKAKELIQLIKMSKKIKNQDGLIIKIEEIKFVLSNLNKNFENDINQLILNIKNKTNVHSFNKQLINKLKQFKTSRQVELNQVYKELLLDVKKLKHIAKETNKHSKVAIKKLNLRFTLNKIETIQEAKKAWLFTKGTKLINSQAEMKIAKGNELIELSKKSEYKEEKITKIQNKIKEIDQKINQNITILANVTNLAYENIEKHVNKISQIKNKDMTHFKNNYFNDIHKVEIQEKILLAR